MNKRDDPYTPGAGRKPRTLAGREEDLDAFEALVERLESGFELATDAEQRYPSAMASLGEGPYQVAKVAQAFGTSDQRHVSALREGLIQKGLIWTPRRGRLDFTVPLFDRYLRAERPV